MIEKLTNIKIIEKKPDSPEIERYRIDDYDIVLENPAQTIKPTSLEEVKTAANSPKDNLDTVKNLLRETLDAPKLTITDKQGRAITGEEFNKLRSKIWAEETEDQRLKRLIGALKQNYLTFSKIYQINNILEFLPDTIESNQIKLAYHQLVDPVDKYAYKAYTIEEKRRFMDKINELIHKSLN